jgi:hypothetical protein
MRPHALYGSRVRSLDSRMTDRTKCLSARTRTAQGRQSCGRGRVRVIVAGAFPRVHMPADLLLGIAERA